MKKPIIFWGATGQAKVLAEFVGALGYELVALFDNNPETPSPVPGVPLHFTKHGFQQWRQENAGEVFGLVAIGGSRGRDRVELQRFLVSQGIRPAVVIHPAAFVASNAKLGLGSQICARATVCAEAEIGEACIVNSSANVDHECHLADGVHVAPGAVLSGCVEVGEYSLVGTGAVVLPRIKIGANVVIGAGSVVTRDVPANSVVYGNPARIKRQNPLLL